MSRDYVGKAQLRQLRRNYQLNKDKVYHLADINNHQRTPGTTHTPHLRPSLSLNHTPPPSFPTLLHSEVLNDFERLCSEMSLQQTNQRGQHTFVPAVNLLYHTAINVSVDQVIKPRRFVCFISRFTGLGNSDTHTHASTRKNKLRFYQWKVSPLFWLPAKALSFL